MRLYIPVFAAVLFASSLWAQPPAERMQAVIGAQIQAFRSGDFSAAFEFASPGIRRLFGTVDRFEYMVRQGYPMVIAPSELRFVGQEQDGAVSWQRVLITTPEGTRHLLLYRMIDVDGAWRIDGVFLAPPQDAAV